MPTSLMAPCGFDCLNCPAYKATRGVAKEQERVAARWSKANGKKMTAADILCDGCLGGGRLVAFCAGCAIRTCALAKGYPTCAHCPAMLECGKITTPKTREMLIKLKETLGI
jgi:hypothetical protein